MNPVGMHRIVGSVFQMTAWAAVLWMSLLSPLQSAPLPPVGKADIDGTI